MSEKEYYDLHAQYFGKKYIENVKNSNHEMERFGAVLSFIDCGFENLLDVGCGSGVFLKLLQQEYPDIEACGIERSINLVELASSELAVNVTEGSVEKLPFSSQSFDIVTAMEVIEHLPVGVYEKALSEIERIAKRRIILTVPYREVRKFVRCPECQCKFSPIYHLRTFDDVSLKDLFKGYKLVESKILKMNLPMGFKLRIRIKNLLNLNKFGPTTVCPSCNFSYLNKTSKKIWKKDLNLLESGSKTKKFRINIFPKIEQSTWIVALYHPI